MRTRYPFIIALSLCLISSCSRHNRGSIIVECDSFRAVDIDFVNGPQFSHVDLNPAPLRFPDHVVILDDGTFLLKTKDTLFRYNLSDGSRVMTYSRRGRADKEFVSLTSYWLDRDSLFLFDFSSQKVLVFNIDDSNPTRVIKSVWQDAPLEDAERLGEHYWVGKRVGGMPDIPELSLYDNDFNYISDLGNRTLRSGLGIGHPLSRNREGVLFTMAYSNDIQQVTLDSCFVKYKIKFLEGSMNPDNYNDEYEMVQDRALRQKNGDLFSCLPSRIIEDDKYLTFLYLYYNTGEQYSMYAIYDKKQKDCKCFRILCPEDWTVFPIRHDETVYFFAYFDNGFRVYYLPIHSLIQLQ